jgi:probable F420-dependent oxidoreductase
MLRFGLFSINAYACIAPEVAARVARAAEAAGFDSLWGGEHVVLPDPQAPPSPMAPHEPILDPVTALTYCAAVTSRVRLGTGIIILPQRNPLVLAKELASLDRLSNGRLIFGIGVGYLEPEFRALGAPFEHRGAVTDEYLAAMRAIWTQDKPAFSGRFVSFANVQAHPQPMQRPHPPIVVGGRTPAAFRRAVEQGDGWYGFGLDPARTAEMLTGLREAATRHARPAGRGPLEISVTPARGTTVDTATAAAYAALGVHRLILMPPPALDSAGLERFVDDVGARLVGRV